MTIAVGQSTKGALVNSTSDVVTGSVTTAATGSSFYIGVITSGAVPAITSVYDAKGNTYTRINVSVSSGGVRVDEYLCTNGTGGSGHTFSVSYGGSTSYAEIFAIEITGGASASLIDQVNHATGNTVPLNSGNAVLGAVPGTGELILSLFWTANNVSGMTFTDSGSPGTTVVQSQTDGTLLNPAGCVGSAVVSVNGTYSTNWTDAGAVKNRIVTINTFVGPSGQGAASSAGTATATAAAGSVASGSFVTSGVATVSGVPRQLSPAAAYARGTAHQGLVPTSGLMAGAAVVQGVGNQYLNISASAAYSVGSSHTHSGLAPSAIASVFAGATVTGNGYGFTLGQSAGQATGAATVTAITTQGASGSAVTSAGVATMRAQTPDMNIMGVGAGKDAAAAQVYDAIATATGAIVNASGGGAAGAYSQGSAAVTGISFAGQAQTVFFVGDAVANVTGVAGTIVAAAAYSAGVGTAKPTNLRKALSPLRRDGRLIVKANQQALSARDEEEILSIMPHIMNHIAQFEARRLQ